MGKQNNNHKTKVKIGIIVFFFFAVLIALLTMIDFEALYLKLSGPIEVDAPSYSEKDFAPADYEIDIMTDPAYLKLNRVLTWSENGITEKLLDNNYQKYDKEGELIHRYFDSLIRGDADAYNRLYSTEYIKKYGLQSRFPMQRVYDMSVTVLERSEDNVGAEHLTIKLSYKIQLNDGTVRNDMLSDASVPIDIKVEIPAGGEAQIRSITRYYDGQSLDYPSVPIVWAILLVLIPILMIIGFIITVIIIIRRRTKKGSA
ncbi:MAG: hypothetical protein E7599_07060 [Ruminococcaceae bacterium]|nr:hypothetical protein [Oscillospiraceae bacterium]